MARRAEGVPTAAAKEDSNGATVHALIVNELVTVLLTLFLAPVKRFLAPALLAQKVFFFDVIFLLHGLEAVLGATKVVLPAVRALKKGVGVHGEGSKLPVVVISRSDNPSFQMHTILLGLLHSLLHDQLLESQMLKKL